MLADLPVVSLLKISFVVTGPVNPVEIQPLLPPQSGEKQPDDSMRFFLDALLEFVVSQVIEKNILYVFYVQAVQIYTTSMKVIEN
jgi:hypothetical protein